MAAACDGIMECDSVVLLSEGHGTMTSKLQNDGTLSFEFPPGGKPNVKLTSHDMTLTPWLKQAHKGVIHPPSEVESSKAPEVLYKKYIGGRMKEFLEGENLIFTTFGDDKTRKIPIILGDSNTPKSLLHCFFEELFKSQDIENREVCLSAYSYSPATEDVLDLIAPEGESRAKISEAEASRAGNDMLGLHTAIINNYETAQKEVAHINRGFNKLRVDEDERVELRAEQMSLKSKKKADDGGDVIDLDFEGGSPTKKKEGVSSYIPEAFYENVVCINVTVTHGHDPEATKNRTSSNWCNASFIILPDNARPEAVGALSSQDVKRYEKVQKLVCSLLAILTAIRLKRRRVPFLAHKWTSTLRFAFRQTGEKEDETKVIKNASFRKRKDESREEAASPVNSTAPPPKSVVFINLCQKGEVIMENYHSFVCAKRFSEMAVANTGMFTRHLQVEQCQMDREIASLALQLEVAKQIHSYRPLLYGMATKGDKTIIEREQNALERKKAQIEAQEEERRVRIQTAAEHIAERNIHEEMSRLAQVQQQYDDKKAQQTRVQGELRKWKAMTTDHLDKEIKELTSDAKAAERKVADLEARQRSLESEKSTIQKGITEMQKRMQDHQRKAMQAVEAQKHAAHQAIEQRKERSRNRVDEMRSEIEYAGDVVLQRAEELLRLYPKGGAAAAVSKHFDAQQIHNNLQAAVNGLKALLPRLMPCDPPVGDYANRIALVREKVIKASTHELLSLQASIASDGLQLPIYPSAEPATKQGPMVSLHITALGVTGIDDHKKNNKFSLVIQRRGGNVLETPRIPLKTKNTVEWDYLFKLPLQLPAEKKDFDTAIEFCSFAIAEFLPDGSFCESLPFDVDLHSMACRPQKVYHLLPCRNSNLRVAVRVSTKKLRPTEVQLNPLYTLSTLRQVKHTEDYGPSSDEDEP